MEKANIAPITAETFEQSWVEVDMHRRKAKRQLACVKVPSFFSNLVFAVLVLFVGNGLIYTSLQGSYCRFLREIPYFLSIWNRVNRMITEPLWPTALRILVPVVLVYLISFLVYVVFMLLTLAIYHPFKRKLPDAVAQENAQQLLQMARDARRYSRKSTPGISLFWALFFVMIQFGLIAMYWLTELKGMDAMMEVFVAPVIKVLEPYLGEMTAMQLSSLSSSLFMPTLMVFCVSFYVIYALFNLIHTLSTRVLRFHDVPYQFVAEVEHYAAFAGEETEGLTPEEIAQKRRDCAEETREKAIEMEKIHAHAKAKELFCAAAHSGDVPAMEHYARHWLIIGAKDPGRYWLQKAVDSGQASEFAVKTLKRLKWHRKYRAEYLK